MKKLFFIPLTVLLLIGQSVGGSMAKNNDPESDDNMPELPVAIQNLKKFVGDWQAKVSLTMGDKKYTVDYIVSCKETANGSGLYMDEWFTDPILGTMKGNDLVGYDPFDNKIKWFSVDNMGSTNEHVGKWKSTDHLYLEYDGVRNGKKFVDIIDFYFKGNDELEFKGVSTLNDKEIQKGEGVFHKK